MYSYVVSNFELPVVTHIKNLGVIFESNLAFNLHISIIFNKTARQLGLLDGIVIILIK